MTGIDECDDAGFGRRVNDFPRIPRFFDRLVVRGFEELSVVGTEVCPYRDCGPGDIPNAPSRVSESKRIVIVFISDIIPVKIPDGNSINYFDSQFSRLLSKVS